MNRVNIEELHKLSVKEKIKIVQALWDDIANEQSIEDLPESHKKTLYQRLEKIRNENASFKSWEDIQNKYKQL